MQFELRTTRRFQHISILSKINQFIEESNLTEGVCMIQCPCSSVGITMMKQNEDLSNDLIYGMEKSFPAQDPFFHYAGNTGAHLKSVTMGNTCFVMVQHGKVVLEANEDIVFCEFDGGKSHTIMMTMLA